MIITLEHEDIEAALLAWMNDKGMAASADSTSIAMSKARNTGRITAVIDPNGKDSKTSPQVTLANAEETTDDKVDNAGEKNLFDS